MTPEQTADIKARAAQDHQWGPWIEWNGGECPIPDAKAQTFELRFRDGEDHWGLQRYLTGLPARGMM